MGSLDNNPCDVVVKVKCLKTKRRDRFLSVPTSSFLVGSRLEGKD